MFSDEGETQRNAANACTVLNNIFEDKVLQEQIKQLTVK
jgi:hypothetical protein